MPDITTAVVIALIVLVFAVLVFRARPRRRERFDRSAPAEPALVLPDVRPTPSASAAPKLPPLERGLPASAAKVLTPREQQIALLAARGLTNRQIADEVELSPNTVANHLKNVYRKLEVRSRAELAWRLHYSDLSMGDPSESSHPPYMGG